MQVVRENRYARYEGGHAPFALSLLMAYIAALLSVSVRTLLEFLRVHGLTIHSYALHEDDAWLTPPILLLLGLLVGLAVRW